MSTGARLVVTTPEHVELELEPAGAGSRFMALLVDTLLFLAIAGTADMLLKAMLPAAVGAGLRIGVAFAIKWGYDVYFETRHNGRTPGKQMLGLRVVGARGLPVTLHQAFVRNVVRVIDFAPLFYGLGGLVALLDRHGRRLGDIAADTLVVREARSLDDVRRLVRGRRYNSLRTPRIARLARHRIDLEERELLLSLCLRADELDDAARYDLMQEVGAHYRAALRVDDPSLSDENLVRGLTAVLYSERRAG